MAFLVSPSLSLHVSFPHRSLSSIPARSPLFFFFKGFPQFRLCVDVVSRDPLTSAVLSAWLSARLPWVNDIFVFVRHLLLFFFLLLPQPSARFFPLSRSSSTAKVRRKKEDVFLLAHYPPLPVARTHPKCIRSKSNLCRPPVHPRRIFF